MSGTAFDPDELPLIGEPFPVEFANSLYITADGSIDFLATPDLIKLWFEAVDTDVTVPTIRRADAAAIRELRDAVHSLLRAVATGTPPAPAAVAILNRYAAKAPWFLHLACSHDGHLAVIERRHGRAIDVFLGQIANETIQLLDGSAKLLRRCNGPGCAMLFIKNHHKRRWCHQSCGHRARQAEYYRRQKSRH